MIHSRRNFLKLGILAAAGSAIPVRKALAQTHGGHVATTPELPAFVDALPIPTVLRPTQIGAQDVYSLIMKEGVTKCHRDLPPTNILGFNGVYPGPTIRATKGRAVQIRQRNLLPSAHSDHTTGTHLPAVHMHGALVPAISDGHPNDGIPLGGTRVYTYPNRQRGCALWYHDHTHGATGHNVYMGLAGLYFLDDPQEKLLRLPRGAYEIPLVIQDRSFDALGQLVYTLDDSSLETGVHGDAVLINGKIQPFFKVANRKYRLRILNGSNARIYTLRLSTGAPMIQIGTDGGLLQRPVYRDSITIAPSERVDCIVDFSQSSLGSSFILQNLQGIGRTASLMQFQVNRLEADNAVIPSFLAPWTELPAPVATRQFELSRQLINGTLTWAINGFGFDSPGRPVPAPKINTVEHWRFVNRSNHPHPMHLHLVQFQIVSVDGEPVDSSEYGWKDTIVIPPGSDLTVAARFEGFRGKYVFHCHNLEHEDFAMMSEFEVTA